MCAEISKNKNSTDPIDNGKIQEIFHVLCITSDPLFKKTPIVDSKEKTASAPEEIKLAELILRTAFDSKTQKVLILETGGFSTISFVDKDFSYLAQLKTCSNILIALRNVLLNYSWTVDEDGESSQPIHHFKFSENEQGAITVMPTRELPNGALLTTLEIFHVKNSGYLLPAIIES